MSSCSSADVRRCRPLLGTFVEVAAAHASPREAHAAIDAAFAAVERAQRAMSFHDPTSELSRVNRSALRRPVRVGAGVYRVLACAKRLHALTRGVFDVAVGGELVRRGLLPRHPFAPARVHRGATTRDVVLLPGRRVRFRRPLLLDLGGIAKGYAVDRAVAALRAAGATGGLVNAGGDLRAFGPAGHPVWVRHPRSPDLLVPLLLLRDAALATSANVGPRRSSRLRCPHVDGRTRGLARRPFSVSVRAATCMLADALTKVVLVHGEATPLLADFGAEAWVIGSRDGAPRLVEPCSA
jgi:thiamine biosynthesis lipoprotein